MSNRGNGRAISRFHPFSHKMLEGFHELEQNIIQNSATRPYSRQALGKKISPRWQQNFLQKQKLKVCIYSFTKKLNLQ